MAVGAENLVILWGKGLIYQRLATFTALETELMPVTILV
jgi:hypothetical protein